jgi:hypothetical protein
MKNIVLVFSIFISSIVSSAQLLIDTPSLDSSISHYKKSINDINWQFRDPVFGAVFYCTQNDSIYWSISNLKNNWEFDSFHPDYYYKYDNEYVMIRIGNCNLDNFQQNIFLPINDSSSLILKEALYPETVLISGIYEIQIFYLVPGKRWAFLLYATDYDFPSNFYSIFPAYFPKE